MSTAHETPPGGGYERTDARPVPLIRVGLAMVALVAAAFITASFITRGLTDRVARKDAEEDPVHPMAATRRPPTAALLQADPPAEMESYLEQVRERATTYGWIDADAGVVRLPVDRAIELVAERGLPARTTDEPR